MKIRRDFLTNASASIISVLLALAVGGLIIAFLGGDPFKALYTIFAGALEKNYGIGNTINLTSILLLTGLSAVVAFKAGVWNFGIEGQLYLGALGAVIVIFQLQWLGPLTVPVAIAVGILFGSMFAALAGALRVKLNVTEGVSTLLLNYVAYLIIDFVAAGPIHDPAAAIDSTPIIPRQFILQPFPGSLIQPYVLLGVAASLILFFMLGNTKYGFEMRIMGSNPRAAQYIGIKTHRKLMTTILISGALAGLAGCLLVLGSSFVLFIGISKNYGWLGIAVALLGSLNPIATIVSAFFISTLNVGGIAMQSVTGVPYEVAQVVVALIVIIVLVRPVLEKVISSVS